MFDAINPAQLTLIVGIGMAIFLVVLLLVMGTYWFITARESPVKDRLEFMKKQIHLEKGEAAPNRLKDIKDAILEVLEPLGQKFYGGNFSIIQSLKTTLTEAGLPDTDQMVRKIFGIRIATGLLVGMILFFCVLVAMKNFGFALIGLIGGMLVGGMYPNMRLTSMAQKRKSEIRFTLSDTLDLMVVCMEAGLGLDATIQRISEETEQIAPEISYEFKRLTKELNAGIPRIDAFHNLGSRTGVDELRSLCALIIQTDKLGTSVADTLRIYADDVRTKRKQRAELLASQASIKMTFPLVLFIFPPMFIVLLGPAVLTMIKTFANR
jgi:tight adherence protein C